MHTLAKSGPRPGSWVASCCAGRPRERRASQVRSAVPQTVAAAAAKGGPYTAVNRYRVVEDAALAAFHAELASRKAHAASQPGYVGHEVRAEAAAPGGQQEFSVTQTWESKEAYEAWFNTPFRRRSHFPPGVWQHRPENKFSVPEEFCPFVQETGAKDE